MIQVCVCVCVNPGIQGFRLSLLKVALINEKRRTPEAPAGVGRMDTKLWKSPGF